MDISLTSDFDEQLIQLKADIQQGIDDYEAGRYVVGTDFFDEILNSI